MSPDPAHQPQHPLEPKRRRGVGSRNWPSSASLLGVGVELAGVVALMTLLGWWLDKKFDTSPTFLLILAAVGIIGGLYNTWKQAKRFM